MKIQSFGNISFDLIKTLIKILFSLESAKLFYLDLIKTYKNIDKDTIFIKFWNAKCKYRQKFRIIKKDNKNLNRFENSKEY